MAQDMGRGIIAPGNNDIIGTGASEMRTLGATTRRALDDMDLQTNSRVGYLENTTQQELAHLDQVMLPRTEAEQYGIEGKPGPPGPPSDIPGPPGPGGSIALEETDPGCFVDSPITWLQWDTSVGTVVRAWNPATESYHMIHGDTGERDISHLIPESFPSGRITIRRSGDLCYLRIDSLDMTNNQGGSTPIPWNSLPVGFRTSVNVYEFLSGHDRVPVSARLNSSNSLSLFSVESPTVSGYIVYTTYSTWPSSLPGEPV